MATSKDFIRANLENYTNASCSDFSVENNRYHYHLRFEESVGWDWIYTQVQKCQNKLDIELEPYKISPSGMNDFEVEIREVRRRAGIDDNQHSLGAFER